MKSLIIKDLYNIGHNLKSLIFMLAVFAVIFIPSSGAETYLVMSVIMCAMMVVTTFAFDETSNWPRYAMIMPVSRKNLVAGKFVALAIFCGFGAVVGLVVGAVGGLITKKVALSPDGLGELLLLALTAWALGMIFGGIVIPLLFKFGAEKGRMLMMVSVMIPAALCFGVYWLLKQLGVEVSDQLVFVLLCCSPVLALAWSYGMYRLSCGIFEKKEL